MRESVEEAKAQHLLFITSVIFRSNKVHFNDRNALDKTVSVDRNNNAGVREQNPRRFDNFTAFFQKIRIFRHILV